MSRWQRVLYQPGIPLGEDGRRVTDCKAHRQLSKEAAKEGMVLLKNEGHLLPLAKGTRIALFGKGTFDYVKGGGGSGDVTVSSLTNLYDGFQKQKGHVQIYAPLADFYRAYVKEQYESGAVPGIMAEPSVPEPLYQGARHFADVAVISICRFSGEGWDRTSRLDRNETLEAIQDPIVKQSSALFEEGDFYLSAAERTLVETVKRYFSKIVVVLNVGGILDSGWFAEEKAISSVLLAWQGGMEGGSAAAELLCGIGNPSGKLSDTFAASLEAYPSSCCFHESERYVNYIEDIFVGYRYFETIPGAKEQVIYPFGFGLSYTSFDWKIVWAGEKEDQIIIRVQIVNTGELEGKEVLQVYGIAPQGVLGKAQKSLLAFAKTRLLKTGEMQVITLTFPVGQMASYDDLGKIQKSAYVLEKGTYQFFVGTSVREGSVLDFVYSVPSDRIVRQLTQKIAPTSLKKRMTADGGAECLPLSKPNDPDACEIPVLKKESLDGLSPDVRGRAGVNLWTQKYKEGIRPLSEAAEGRMTLDQFLAQMTDEEVAHLLGGQPNTGVANTFGFGNMPEYGIPSVMTADGPAGLRIEPKCGVSATAWPCATLLACTWNPQLAEQVGEAGAKEVRENNIAVWLTPAVNIHRSPLCGRNFEYYSEDPFLTGKMASAMVRGIQSQHISAAVKHFALNNKETNRKNSDSRVSERAAREIYLKAFEIIVTESDPWCIMTSYNIINGHRASENRELLQGILRDEWGFSGMVTTDWWTMGKHYKEVKAGNDVKMARGFSDRLLLAKEKGVLSREEMEQCAKRILELILKMD